MSADDIAYYESVKGRAPLFKNIEIADELSVVKMLCAYIDYSGTSKDKMNISPIEYRMAAFGNEGFEKDHIWALSIRLAHGVSMIGEKEISYEVVKRALLIAAYVKDYERLEELLQKKRELKELNTSVAIQATKPVSFLAPEFCYLKEKSSVTPLEELAVAKGMQYVKYGYLDGLQKLLANFGGEDLLRRFLFKAARWLLLDFLRFRMY